MSQQKPIDSVDGTQKHVDWGRIKSDYRAEVKSQREIAREYTLTEGAIRKRAKRDGWTRAHAPELQPVVLAEVDALDRAGFVYVIYLQDSAAELFYKIGMAASFTSRFTAHQCSSPFPICIACVYFVGNMRAEERELHRIFAKQRVRGEWFRLSDCDLQKIAGRAKLV
ncbi:MAG: GIY-YIG nuclease family protein [Comamonas sp.]|uniref:GIY-YIG nuclease family protein n=1 Tax=Comamonas sp. TaxID=34028 RepID=UPI002FC6494C